MEKLVQVIVLILTGIFTVIGIFLVWKFRWELTYLISNFCFQLLFLAVIALGYACFGAISEQYQEIKKRRKRKKESSHKKIPL